MPLLTTPFFAASPAGPSCIAARPGIREQILRAVHGWADAARHRREARAAERAMKTLSPRLLRDLGLEPVEEVLVVPSPFGDATAMRGALPIGSRDLTAITHQRAA